MDLNIDMCHHFKDKVAEYEVKFIDDNHKSGLELSSVNIVSNDGEEITTMLDLATRFVTKAYADGFVDAMQEFKKINSTSLAVVAASVSCWLSDKGVIFDESEFVDVIDGAVSQLESEYKKQNS